MARRWLLPAIVLVGAVWAWHGLDMEVARLNRAADAAVNLADEFWPADFSPFSVIWGALIETIQIALLATVFGTVLSVPVGLIAARNLFPPAIATPVRMAATAVRVLPAILWAIFAVIVVGQGPLAGVVALTFYTIGYLTKLQSEAIEGIPRDALDAVRAMGAPRWQQAWHVALPEAANALRSQVLFMFEYNVRNSSVLGIVAAGGIGVHIVQAIDFHAFDRVMAYVIALFVTVAIIDAVSYLVRRRYIELEESPKARWRDTLWPLAQD